MLYRSTALSSDDLKCILLSKLHAQLRLNSDRAKRCQYKMFIQNRIVSELTNLLNRLMTLILSSRHVSQP